MGETTIRLTRQELYERVWGTPLLKLGPELGMSGRGLAKLCARERIPVPRRGYWKKKAAGWEPTKAKLPDQGAKNDTITFHLSPQVVKAVEISSLPVVEVPSQLEKPHPVVVATRRVLRAARLDESGRLRAVFTEGTLDLHVSPEALDRALRIAQGVIAALEAAGGELGVCEERKHWATVKLHGENIPWEIAEETQRQERSLTRAERLEREQHPINRDWGKNYDVRPTGRLMLSLLTGDYSGLRRHWRDSARHSLESRLPRAVRGFLDLAEYLQRKTIERKEELQRRIEEEARRQEAQRRQYIYERRHKALAEMVDVAEEASRLRTFLANTEARIGVPGSVTDANSDRWLAWARRHLAWLEGRASQFPPFGDETP